MAPHESRMTDDLERAEVIRAQYAAIVESSNDAIIAKDLDGVISAWNAAAERMFGYTEREAIGQPIAIVIPADMRDEEHDILRRLRSGERIQHCETIRITKTGERLNVSLTISPLRDAAGNIVGCSKIARDITEAKRAEAALRQSEQRLAREVARAKTLQAISARLLSESAPESLYAQILGAAIELMGSDAASVQMLAADQASLTLLGWRNFHPESAAFWQCVEVGAGSTCSKALSDNERVVVSDVEASEFMAGTQDLEEYRRSAIRAVQSTPLQSRSGRPLGMLSTHWQQPHNPTDEDFRFFDVLARQAADLIERTLAEEALSTVNQRLIEAHEEERRRIARELHDDISQRLALVSTRLGFLKRGSSAPVANVDREIENVSEEVVNLMADIQALSHGLHPGRLELLGLEKAAAGLCEELSTRHGLTIDILVEDIPRPLSRELSLCLYRVLQESLQNVIKHSVSGHACVALKGQAGNIEMTIQDSGAGFDPHESIRGRGLGLTSMKERLKAVGGYFSIQSQRGHGTSVYAIAPLSLPLKPGIPGSSDQKTLSEKTLEFDADRIRRGATSSSQPMTDVMTR
jgi:PAS domain S-box-containing protein